MNNNEKRRIFNHETSKLKCNGTRVPLEIYVNVKNHKCTSGKYSYRRQRHIPWCGRHAWSRSASRKWRTDYEQNYPHQKANRGISWFRPRKTIPSDFPKGESPRSLPGRSTYLGKESGPVHWTRWCVPCGLAIFIERTSKGMNIIQLNMYIVII